MHAIPGGVHSRFKGCMLGISDILACVHHGFFTLHSLLTSQWSFIRTGGDNVLSVSTILQEHITGLFKGWHLIVLQSLNTDPSVFILCEFSLLFKAF